MKKTIILLIIVLLLSGCLEEKADRIYTYNFTDPNYINHTETLILHSDGKYSLSDLNYWCNCSSTDSGNYTETDNIISIQFLTNSTFTKNGSDLVDKDGNTWQGMK